MSYGRTDAMNDAPGMWFEAPPSERHRLELADGRLVEVLAYTAASEVPGRYRVRDERGRVVAALLAADALAVHA